MKLGCTGFALFVGAGVVSLTIKVQVPLFVVSTTDVAVICAVPVSLQVTRPFWSTYAILESLDQVTAWLGLFVPLTVAVTVNDVSVYKSIVLAAGVTLTLVTVGVTTGGSSPPPLPEPPPPEGAVVHPDNRSAQIIVIVLNNLFIF